MDTGVDKLDMELVDQGPGHVLQEIVVRMTPGEIDVKDQGQRARDEDLVLTKLGHTDVKCLFGLGTRGVERDAPDCSLGLHGTQGLFAVAWKEVRWHGHRVYIYVYVCVFEFNVYKPSMSGLDPIPEEDPVWDYYYRLYYDDEDDDVQNSVYTPQRMADYDPTTENENPALDIALDNDDDDDDDDTTPPGTPGPPGATSTPYQPGATSTPHHPSEAHEMTNLPQEQSGMVHGPGEPAWNALTHIYPNASATELEAFYDPTSQRLKVKMTGAGKASYYLYTTQQGTGIERLNPQLTVEIRKALGESAVDQASDLQQERGRNSQEIRAKTQTKQQLEKAAQDVQTLRQEMDALRNQSRQLDDEIRKLEDRTGPLDEEALL